jgi:hypothetical protein
MVHYFHLAIGDICADPTGLRVRVEDIDIYDYAHFSIIEASEPEEDEQEMGEMSHVAFVHRFTRLGDMFSERTAA